MPIELCFVEEVFRYSRNVFQSLYFVRHEFTFFVCSFLFCFMLLCFISFVLIYIRFGYVGVWGCFARKVKSLWGHISVQYYPCGDKSQVPIVENALIK